MPKIAQKMQKPFKNSVKKTKNSTDVENWHTQRVRCIHLFYLWGLGLGPLLRQWQKPRTQLSLIVE